MPKPSEEYWKFVSQYPSMRKLFEDRAEANKDKVFLYFKDEKYTYGELNESSDRVAAALAEMGVKKGTKVSMFMFNSPEWVTALFALAKLGAVLVPLNTALKGDPLIYQATQSDSEMMIIDSRLLESYKRVEDELKTLKNVVVTVKNESVDSSLMPNKPHVTFDELQKHKPNEEVKVDITYKDTMCIMYTSGTTGPSKGCVMPAGFGLYNAFEMADYLEYTKDDVLYCCLPLFHGNALALSLLASVVAEASLALAEWFSASRFWEDCCKYGATAANLLADMHVILFKQPTSEYEKEHNVKRIFSAPVVKELYPFLKGRYGCEWLNGYGLTENGIVTLWSLEDARAGRMDPGSIGKAVPFADVAIMDPETGELLPPGKVGEIVTRPKLPFAMFKEYYKMPEKTIQAWENLWFHTGDLGYMDENGAFYFVDRIKDMIRRRGENISSFELEKALYRNPKIAELAAVPVKTETGDEEVKVCIVLKPGEKMTPEEFMDWCQDNLPYFWIPRFVEFRDSLPKTPTGRVEKYKLREEGVTPNTWDREKAGYKIKKTKPT